MKLFIFVGRFKNLDFKVQDFGNFELSPMGKESILKCSRLPDKNAYVKIIFLISQPKYMLWVLKRTVSMRRFF